MKAPWKFLAQLTSRRRPAKIEESSAGRDDDPEAFDAGHSSAHLTDDSTQAFSAPDLDGHGSVDEASKASDKTEGGPDLTQGPGMPIGEGQALAFDEAYRGAEADKSEPKNEASTKPRRKPRAKHRERTERLRAQALAQSVVATGRQSVQPSTSGDPFFNEVVLLDEEIKELRSLLAQKLHLQNAQLRKMLERFDVL